MWALLLLAFPVAEIIILFKVGDHIGLANTFFALLASAVFGIGLIRTQGLFLLKNLQSSLARGEAPADSIIHSMLIFLSGAFFIFPGYLSDVIALLLVIPGTRHFFARLVRKTLMKKMRQGKVHFQSFGGFGAGGFGKPRPPSGSPLRDVTPLELRSKPPKKD